MATIEPGLTPGSGDGQPTSTLAMRLARWLDGDVKRRSVIAPYVILAIGIAGGFVYTARTADDTSEGQVQQSAQTACLARVESRDLVRGVFIDLYDKLEERFPDGQLVVTLRASLDDNYPSLDPKACIADPYQTSASSVPG